MQEKIKSHVACCWILKVNTEEEKCCKRFLCDTTVQCICTREKKGPSSLKTDQWVGAGTSFTPVHESQDTPSCSPPFAHCFGTECRLILTWTFDRIFTHRMQDSSCRLESILLQIWLNNRQQSRHYVIYITSQHKVCNFLLQCYNCN